MSNFYETFLSKNNTIAFNFFNNLQIYKNVLALSCKVVLHVCLILIKIQSILCALRVHHCNESRQSRLGNTLNDTDLENSYESGSCPEVNPC
jgi:hypothetical protein